MMFDDNWWYLIIFDDICIHIFIYVCIDYLLGFAFLTIGVDNFKSAPCVLKLKDLHFAGVHGIIIQLLATALTLKIFTLKHYVTTSFFQRHASFFSGFRFEANGYEVALLPGPTGTASDLVQVLLQLDELTIFTPKGHTPLVEQITLQVKAGAKFSIGWAKWQCKLIKVALIGADGALIACVYYLCVLYMCIIICV